MQKLSSLLASAPASFGELARYIDSCLVVSDGALSIPAALSLLATFKCGRLVGDGHIYPNIYTCSIAPSGSGKTLAQRAISNILKKVNKFELICGVPVSDSGLCKRLASHPRQILLWDELGVELDALSSSKSSFEKRIMKVVMELYSAAGKTYAGKEYATQDRQDVEKPFLNIYGGTTSVRFFPILNDIFLHDGSLARWLFFFPEPGTYNQARKVPNGDHVPANLIDYLNSLEVWEPGTAGNLSASMGVKEKELVADDTTWNLINTIERDYSRKIKSFPDVSINRVFWNRAYENFIKVCLIIAQNDSIDYESVCWASDLVETCINQTLLKCLEHVKPHNEDSVKERFLNVIQVGEKISRSRLITATWRFKLNKSARNELIENLCEAGLWEERDELDPHTRRKTKYYHRLKT